MKRLWSNIEENILFRENGQFLLTSKQYVPPKKKQYKVSKISHNISKHHTNIPRSQKY